MRALVQLAETLWLGLMIATVFIGGYGGLVSLGKPGALEAMAVCGALVLAEILRVRLGWTLAAYDASRGQKVGYRGNP